MLTCLLTRLLTRVLPCAPGGRLSGKAREEYLCNLARDNSQRLIDAIWQVRARQQSSPKEHAAAVVPRASTCQAEIGVSTPSLLLPCCRAARSFVAAALRMLVVGALRVVGQICLLANSIMISLRAQCPVDVVEDEHVAKVRKPLGRTRCLSLRVTQAPGVLP